MIYYLFSRGLQTSGENRQTNSYHMELTGFNIEQRPEYYKCKKRDMIQFKKEKGRKEELS